MRDDDWDERGELGAGDLHLARHATSSSSARAALTLRLRPRLALLMETFLADRTDVEDATQLAMHAVVQQLASFEGERTLESWSDRVAVRTAVRLARARRLRLTRTVADAPDVHDARVLPAELRAQLDRLPEVQRTALVLAEVLGYPLTEIAVVCRTDLIEVRERLVRGRERIRASLAGARTSAVPSPEPCLRWAGLTDRRALGAPLAEAERSFVASHRVACSACAEEAALYLELGSLLEVEPATESVVTAVMAIGEGGERAVEPSRPRVSLARVTHVAARWVAVAMAALAIAIVLSRARRDDPPLPARPAEPSRPIVTPIHLPRARIALLGGTDVLLDGAPAQLEAALDDGARLATQHGKACLWLEPGGQACLGPHTVVQFQPGVASVLALERGTVFLESEGDLPTASVRVRGRTLALEQHQPGALAVHVPDAANAPATLELLDGAATLHGEGVAPRALGPRVRATLEGPTRPLTPHDVARLDAWLPRALPPSWGEPSAQVVVESRPAGQPVRIDGTTVGTTPLRLLVAPGTHALAIGPRTGRTHAQHVELTSGQTLTLRMAP